MSVPLETPFTPYGQSESRRWLVLFGLLSLLFILPAAWSPGTVIGNPTGDLPFQHYYFRIWAFQQNISAGHFPLWNPHILGGTPTLAGFHSGLLYPPNYLFCFLPPVLALHLFFFLHLLASQWFCFLFLGSLSVSSLAAGVGSIVFTFSAPLMLHIAAGHLNVIAAMIWVPLHLYYAGRLLKQGNHRDSVFLALSISWQVLAGHPQYVFYSMCFLFSFALFFSSASKSVTPFRGPLWLILSGILALLITAPQWLSTLELLPHISRGNSSWSWVAQFSLPVENLITLVSPAFFGRFAEPFYWGKYFVWEMNAYHGILPLILCFFGIAHAPRRERFFFLGGMLLALALALGDSTPLLKWLYQSGIGVHHFRGHSKWLVIFSLCLVVLSAYGIDRVRSLRANRDSPPIFPGLIMLVLLSAAWNQVTPEAIRTHFQSFVSQCETMVPSLVQSLPLTWQTAGEFARSDLIISALLIFMSFGTLRLFKPLPVCRHKPRPSAMTENPPPGVSRWAPVLLLLIVILDLSRFSGLFYRTTSLDQLDLEIPVITALSPFAATARIITPGWPDNAPMTASLDAVGGYDSIVLRRTGEFLNTSQGIARENPLNNMNIRSVNRYLHLLGCRYIILPPSMLPASSPFPVVFRTEKTLICENPSALPRAYILHRVRVESDTRTRLKELSAVTFNPQQMGIIEDVQVASAISAVSADVQSPFPEIRRPVPECVIIDAVANATGTLVFTDAVCPGWNAFLNGVATKIYPVNHMMRGVTLPPGKHRVTFTYQPDSWYFGIRTALGGLLAISVLLLYPGKHQQH